jgi:hypothetical protein
MQWVAIKALLEMWSALTALRMLGKCRNVGDFFVLLCSADDLTRMGLVSALALILDSIWSLGTFVLG